MAVLKTFLPPDCTPRGAERYMLSPSQPKFKSAPVKIGTVADLPAPGKVKEVFASGRFLCLANIDGQIHAMDNLCPHWGGPLGQGTIENGRIKCPWHGWPFDPKTGSTPRKANARLCIHRIFVEGNDVLVEFEDSD